MAAGQGEGLHGLPAQAIQGGAVRPGEAMSAGWQRVCTCDGVPPTYFCYSCMAFNGNRQGEPGYFSRPYPVAERKLPNYEQHTAKPKKVHRGGTLAH